MVILKVLCCIVLYAIAGFIAMLCRLDHANRMWLIDEERVRKIKEKYLRICGINERWLGQNCINRAEREIDKISIWLLLLLGIAGWPVDTIAYVYAVITTR